MSDLIGSLFNPIKGLLLLTMLSPLGLIESATAQTVRVRRENDLNCQMVRQDGRRIDLGALCTPGLTGPTAGIVRQSRSCPVTNLPSLRLGSAARSASREQMVAQRSQAVVTVESGLPFNTGMITYQDNPNSPTILSHKGTFGSGFIIDARGFILTSARSVGADCQVFVRLTNGKRLPAQVVRVNYAADVALLRITGRPGSLPVLPVQFGRNSAVGTAVMAISANPVTADRIELLNVVDRRVTSGIISGKLDSGALNTNLPTKSGDTGAPVLNEQGQAIGMVLTEYNPIGNIEVPRTTDPRITNVFRGYSRNIYLTEVLPIQAALRALGVR